MSFDDGALADSIREYAAGLPQTQPPTAEIQRRVKRARNGRRTVLAGFCATAVASVTAALGVGTELHALSQLPATTPSPGVHQ
jgi:hypothetical protein